MFFGILFCLSLLYLPPSSVTKMKILPDAIEKHSLQNYYSSRLTLQNHVNIDMNAVSVAWQTLCYRKYIN